MKHFDIAKWTEFVRNSVGEAERAAMQAHLASGCRRCRQTAELLSKVAGAARRLSQVQVPDYALRCARAIFLLQQPEKVQILPRIPARLLYDSFREPLPAGVRTQQRLSRQALYQAGDYWLDFRLENESGTSRVTLIGQIQHGEHPGKRLEGVPILLVSGKQVLGRAVSNSLGEFQMEYAPTKRLRLYVPMRWAGKRIELPLNHYAGERQESERKARKGSGRRNGRGRPSADKPKVIALEQQDSGKQKRKTTERTR